MEENNQEYKVVYESPKNSVRNSAQNSNTQYAQYRNVPPVQNNPAQSGSYQSPHGVPPQNPNFNPNCQPYQNYGQPQNTQSVPQYNPYQPYPAAPNTAFGGNIYQQAIYEHQIKVKKAKKDLRFFGNMAGVGLLLFIVVNTMLSLILSIPSIYSLYKSSSSFQSAFSIIGSFCYIGIPFLIAGILIKTRDKKSRLLPFDKPNPKRALLGIPIGLSVCFAANIITNIFVNLLSLVGITLSQPSASSPTPETVPALLLALLGTAVMPGLMEEYAMRGIVLQPIRKYGMAFAIISTSLLFGIMHGNLIQAPFAIIVGLAVGFFAIKCKSLWVAVAIHMLNNAFSVIMEYLSNILSKSVYTAVYYVSFGAIMVIGIICAVVLFVTDKEFLKKENGDVSGEEAFILSRGQKFVAFFVNVPMILGIIYMIICTASYVKIGQ